MTPTEYLKSVYQLIKENFRTNDPSGGMPAASAAYLTKRILGDHADYGFIKFKDVLAALAAQGCLRSGPNSKGALSIWLADSSGAASDRVLSSPGYRRLRSQVWFAFVSTVPEGRRYLNTKSGEVRLRCLEPLTGDWTEIIPISEGEERSAAIQFLNDNQVTDPEVQKLLDEDRWFVKLPRKLLAISLDLSKSWNHNRTTRVVNHVTKWCDARNVSSDLVFGPTPTIDRPRHREFQPSSPAAESDVLRRALLDAIERMSNQELLNVSIPAAHLISVLRPDLLR